MPSNSSRLVPNRSCRSAPPNRIHMSGFGSRTTVSASPPKITNAFLECSNVSATSMKALASVWPSFGRILNACAAMWGSNRLWEKEANSGSNSARSARACLQNGFGGNLELFVVKTRRVEGAYWLKSVTDEQQRLNRNQLKDAPNAF